MLVLTHSQGLSYRSVENRNYHHQSRNEVAGGKRIYRHLSRSSEISDKPHGKCEATPPKNKPTCPRECAHAAFKSFALPFCQEVPCEYVRSHRCKQSKGGADSKNQCWDNHLHASYIHSK